MAFYFSESKYRYETTRAIKMTVVKTDRGEDGVLNQMGRQSIISMMGSANPQPPKRAIPSVSKKEALLTQKKRGGVDDEEEEDVVPNV